ncbi:unnamed protein product, partial [marine sediment metagenome]
MDFRQYINNLIKEKSILTVKKPVSIDVEAAAVLKTAEPKPVIFENLIESPGFR